MHEMGIALQIIDIAKASIPADIEQPRVARIHLKIGKLSAVVADSLRFCFDIAAKDTPLAGAELAIKEIAVSARCRECGHGWTLDGPAFSCPECRCGRIELLSGRELDIESIEIEEKDQTDVA